MQAIKCVVVGDGYVSTTLYSVVTNCKFLYLALPFVTRLIIHLRPWLHSFIKKDKIVNVCFFLTIYNLCISLVAMDSSTF